MIFKLLGIVTAAFNIDSKNVCTAEKFCFFVDNMLLVCLPLPDYHMLLSGINNLCYARRHKCFPSCKSNFTAKSNVANGSFDADLALIMQKKRS